MTTTRARRLPFLLLSAGLILALTAAASADAPAVRRPGEPMILPMELSATERAHVLDRARALTGALGIPGEAAEPLRAFEALDRVVVDEVAVRDGDGRATAVIRTEAGRGDVRSLVRLDWSHDADRALVDERTVPGHARRFAMLAGISTPDAPPGVDWDDSMRAWRVSWSRTIDGFPVAGDGLTVWVYRGGQLAALKRTETPAALAIPTASATKSVSERRPKPPPRLVVWTVTRSCDTPATLAATPRLPPPNRAGAAWFWVGTQTTTSWSVTSAVQFIGSMQACARNGRSYSALMTWAASAKPPAPEPSR